MSALGYGMLGLITVIPIATPAGQSGPARYEFDEPHMGTKVTITVYADDRTKAVTAVRAAFKRIREIEAALSDYKKDSEVMRLCRANDADPGRATPVGDDMAVVLKTALDVSKKSGGAFDVTVGPLSQLWREARKAKVLPDPESLKAAQEKVGYEKVTFDPAAKTVRLAIAGMRLDFGGIGKGYAADEALAVLKAQGLPRALVAVSGDIAAGDPPPGRDHWRVQIAPLGTGRPARTVKLANAAVSTSGDLFQFVEVGGKRYSHVLDPKTGLGLTGRRSATVIAPRGILSDSLSKVASMMPPGKALPLIESYAGAAAYIVVKETDEAGEVVTVSKRFGDYLERDDERK
jgi:thiamine biosynthesis lipoprotein